MHTGWRAVRDCWLDLDNPQLRALDTSDEFGRALCERHNQALRSLISEAALDAAVADEIGVAFEQAVLHVQGQISMCYIAMPAESIPRGDLMRQAALLEEMAASNDIDPATVAAAQAALERDIAWLVWFKAEEDSPVPQQIPVGTVPAEAARVLTEILSQR